MKKKLVALLITSTILGGTGVTAFAETQSAIIESTNKENQSDEDVQAYCNNESTNNNNLDASQEDNSIKKVGLFKYVWCNLQDAFNNFCDFIENIMSGNKDNNDENKNEDVTDNSGQATPEEDKVTDNDETITGDDSTIGGDLVNKPEDITPPAQNKPSTGDEITPPATTPSKPITPPSNGNSQQTNNNDRFMAQVEQAIYNKVNDERAKAGMTALSYNKTMEKYARIKSQDMGDKNYFSHEDLQGNLITTQMKKDGVTYRAWGENIAYIGGVNDANALANQFMTNWMNSAGHRKNILSGNFSSIGVGVYKVGNKVYATQEFYK